MPSIVSHGIISFLLFGYKGVFWGILPDLIGFTRYFTKLGFDYFKNGLKKKNELWVPPNKMDDTDWLLYDLSHSLLFWIVLLIIFKKKEIYAGIISVILDILLHSKKIWRGPKFLYPLSNYNFNGIEWNSPLGFTITLTLIIFLLHLNESDKLNIIRKFYLPDY